MNGAIFYSGRYGSTAQYSKWISDATGLPAFSIDDPAGDPSQYDFLILGSSIVFYRATIRRWVRQHSPALADTPIVLFTVSGAPAGAKLDGWVAESLPPELVARMDHVALRGRLNHDDVSWWLKLILKAGALLNRDRAAAEEERHGFDHMDESSIRPVVELVDRYTTRSEPGRRGR